LWVTVLYNACGEPERLNRNAKICEANVGSPPKPQAKDGRAIQHVVGAAVAFLSD